jgi:hypothetical protein
VAFGTQNVAFTTQNVAIATQNVAINLASHWVSSVSQAGKQD